MNLVLWGLIVIVAVYFIAQMMPVKGVKNITTEELKLIIHDRHKQFIDVRTPMEYNHYRIKSFKNIPLQQLRNQLGKIEREKEIVLICRSGLRSLKAARILKRAGYKRLTNVVGGLNHWQR